MVQIKAKRLKGNNEGLYEFRLGLTRSLYKRNNLKDTHLKLDELNLIILIAGGCPFEQMKNQSK